jgi:hypothetical protein
MLQLDDVLQRFCGSEINVTDGDFDFTLISYMQWNEAGMPFDDFNRSETRSLCVSVSRWHVARQLGSLRRSIHKAALERFPSSAYARLYGHPN